MLSELDLIVLITILFLLIYRIISILIKYLGVYILLSIMIHDNRFKLKLYKFFKIIRHYF